MAREIILKVGVEGANEAVNNIQKLEQEMEKLNKQREELINSPSVSSGDFAQQLDEIDSQIGKLEKTYESATGRAAKFENAQRNLDGVAKTLSGSINLVAGSLGAFGVKNEEVEKTLLKVQSAAAFATGIKDLNEGFKALSGTFSVLTKVMLANPFLLIATVVATLVTAFVPLEDILGAVSNAFSSFGKWLGIVSDEAENTTQSIEELEKAQKRLNDAFSKANTLLENDVRLLEAQGASYDEIYELKRKILINDLAQAKLNKDAVAEDKARTDLKILSLEREKELGEIQQENYEKYLDGIKKGLDNLKEAEKAKVVVTEQGSTERFNAEIAAIDKVEQYQIKYAKELGLSENAITILKAENIEKRKKLEEDYYKFVDKLRNDDIESLGLKTKTEEDITKRGKEILNQVESADFRSKSQKRQEELQEIAKAVDEATMWATMGANSISELGNLIFENKKKNLEKGSKEEEKVAKKQFQFNKGLQLSLAIMDGFKAITTSLAQSPIAIGPVPNPAGIASLAFAATTTAINIAKIASTKFQSTGTAPSTGGSTVPNIAASGSITPTTFQPNTFGTNASQQQTFGGQQGATGMVMRAYVTESDINNTQIRLNRIRNASEL